MTSLLSLWLQDQIGTGVTGRSDSPDPVLDSGVRKVGLVGGRSEGKCVLETGASSEREYQAEPRL